MAAIIYCDGFCFMKMIYVTNARMPTEKAHGLQIAKMCESFARLGIDLTLYVPKRKNIIAKNAFAYYGIDKNFKIKYLFCLDWVHFGVLGFFAQLLTFTLLSFVKIIFQKADIIYSRDELFSVLASFFGKKVIYEMHDYPRKRKWFYKIMFAKIAKIISTNKIKKDLLIKEFSVPPEKIKVLPNGVDLQDFKINIDKNLIRKEKNLPQDKKIISYIGKYKTFGQSKGVEEIIYNFAELNKERADMFLLLVGINEEEVSQVKQIFKDEQLGDGVYRIITHVPHKEVAGYMQLSDLLIMNYPQSRHYAQIMSPIKMFEYMASGTPIVATDLPSVRENLDKDNALLINPNNKKEFNLAIKRVLDNNNFAGAISSKAKNDVKKFSWKARASAIVEEIRNL